MTSAEADNSYRDMIIPDIHMYSAANDPETANDPRPQMIPNWTANNPRATNDPHSGPQMIQLKKFGMAWSFSEGENTGR